MPKTPLAKTVAPLLISLALTASPSTTAGPKTTDQGIANYASYLDESYAKAEAAKVEQQLDSRVVINEVEVNGQTWLRLQSQTMDSIEAKSLVVRATAAGFAAWYSSASTPPPSVPGEVATAQAQQTSPPVNVVLEADPRLVAMLPEGPLLGEVFPPRTAVSGQAPR